MQSLLSEQSETKIIYHIDDEETPYLVKVAVPHSQITLADFKAVLSLPRPNYKYFFKSLDDDFGVVKEEIVDDNTKLPIFKGRVVAWLVTADGSNISDSNSQCTERSDQIRALPPPERLGLIGDSRPPSFHGVGHGMDHCGDTTTETESMISSRRGGPQYSSPRHRMYHKSGGSHRTPEHHHNHHNHCRCDQSSSVVTSDIDTTSFVDSDDDEDDDINSHISTTTDETSVSRIHDRRHRRRRRRRMPVMSRTSSISSITESTMSLNIITVTLNLDTVNFLGISIVGQSNKGGDGGIYVGSIMKGGAVALDGRIEPGDMILQVNDVNFEDMSNDDAVKVLREAVQKPGPIKLVVAKCWDPNPKGYFTIPRTEPVRPIDPGAWVAHTEAARAHQFSEPDYPLRPPSVSTLTSTSSSITSSVPESNCQLILDPTHLAVDMDMMTIAKSMASPDSGLDVRDRMWLKITIPNAFIGSDVVDWLYRNVRGFQDRREARKYANQMLKQGFIRHTVNKSSFSEQCYYVFNETLLERDFAQLKVDDDVPPSYGMSAGGLVPQYTGNYAPAFMHPWGSGGEIHNYGMFGAQPFDGNSLSNSGNGMDSGLHRRNDVTLLGDRQSASPGASSDFDDMSQASGPILIGSAQHKAKPLPNPLQQHPNGQPLNGDLLHNNHTNPLLSSDRMGSDQSGNGSTHSETTTTTTRDTEKQLDGQSSDIGGSRQSFRMAMGNPCEFFVDVM